MNYVNGFLFSPDLTKVVLIKKTKPEWQAGMLNGVGGKMELNELPIDAMIREFNEETGLNIQSWNNFATITGLDWTCYFFWSISNLYNNAQTTTDENIGIYNVSEINILNVIPNLKWLIPMCLDGNHYYAECKSN